jgi:hypothetical protein
MRHLTILLVALALPVAAEARDLEVFLGARGGYVGSHGYVDQFDRHSATAPHVGLAFEVIENLLVEASYAEHQAEGTVFSSFQTRWHAHAAEVGLRYVWPVLPWLRPYGRLTGGVLFERYDLEGPSLDVSARQVGFEVLPLAGVEILWPTEALATSEGLFQKATGGLYLELGYRYTRPFDVGRQTPAGGFEGATGLPLELGAFDVQGFVFGGGIVGHF